MQLNLDMTHVLGRTWALSGSTMIGVYRMDGGKCILLDSGEDFEREALAEFFRDAGLTPVGVISSHVHVDHSINNSWLKENYGTRVAVPLGELHLTRDPAMLKSYYYSTTPGMLAREYPGMVCSVDQPVPFEDGPFEFCGVTFQIVHTPGHSADHIAIVTPDNVCFAGDALLSREMLGAKLPYQMFYSRALDSTYKLEQLGCAVLISSHKGVDTDPAALARDYRELLLRRAEDVRQLVTRPMPIGEIWFAINDFAKLYSSRLPAATRMERNLRSILDWLVDTKQLRWYAEKGMVYYAPHDAGAAGTPD